jgi:hypothetical protein
MDAERPPCRLVAAGTTGDFQTAPVVPSGVAAVQRTAGTAAWLEDMIKSVADTQQGIMQAV